MAHATMKFTFLIMTFQFSIKNIYINKKKKFSIKIPFSSFIFIHSNCSLLFWFHHASNISPSLPYITHTHTHTHTIMMSLSAFLMLVMLMALAITRATPYENDSFLNDEIVLQSKITLILWTPRTNFSSRNKSLSCLVLPGHDDM